MTYLLRALFLVCVYVPSWAQPAPPAPWIAYPSANATEYGVYHFRKAFPLTDVPRQLLIHVSADNRYNLFVNGKRVSYGPAKGDLKTYKYDVVDIAPYLKRGKNQLAALVYNGGKDKPLAFLSVQTAFMLRAEPEAFRILNTDASWKVYKNPAYRVISYDEMLFRDRWFYGFYACGGGDDVAAEKYPWGWETADFDDRTWPSAESLAFNGSEPHGGPAWKLVPRNIAFMDTHREAPARIRRVTGAAIPEGAWNGRTKLSIPANTTTTILVDFERFTMGYPELTVSGGAGSQIKIKYAEALYEKVNLKAHRDSVAGKTMFGVWDVFRPDGRGVRTFRPLWKRAFRYVQLVIETGKEPLEIHSLENEYSGYPYPEMATFTSSDPTLDRIFTMSQQTLRLCSGETYYDTPYYEQLSYGGDDRVIGAISTYNSTDDRLFREVMRLYPQSENRETGLFKSAYPSRFDFDMGSWSLAWVQSLHDYYQVRGDSAFVKPFIPNIERVLGFYQRHLDEQTGLIGSVRNQNFIDWSMSKGSLPRADENREMKQSVLLTLYFVHTLDCTARLYDQIGRSKQAEVWKQLAERIKRAVAATCWDADRQLFRDYPDKPLVSQHTNLMAILCDVIPSAQQPALLDRILSYEKFDERVSSYFSFFLFKVMEKTGREDLFLKHLGFWEQYLNRGFTTCGETGFPIHDRSDCHAWSAHPAYYLLSSVCGIKPADIGFNQVKITPHPGHLTRVSASMPHPKGRISVNYQIQNGQLRATVSLPPGLTGVWQYNGQTIRLQEGENRINPN